MLALARQVESAGVPCRSPIFWMATEDRQTYGEVNQSLLLTNDFQLAPFTAPIEGKLIRRWRTCSSCVAESKVAAAAGLLGESLAADYLRECYREGETFSDACETVCAHVRRAWVDPAGSGGCGVAPHRRSALR